MLHENEHSLQRCRDGLEDPLEDQGMINQQLDQVSYDLVQENMTSISDR